MLLGQYANKIDDKSRISFPKRFRSVIGDDLIITKGFENSLIVVSSQKWSDIIGRIDKKSFTSQNARETQRFLFGGALFVSLDEKGRFLLPEYLKKHAKIEEEIMFIGMSRYVEIWDKKNWDDYDSKISENISSIAQLLQEGEMND